MKYEWKSISDEKPKYYRTVLISDDGGKTHIRAYLVHSEKHGYLWVECGKMDEDLIYHFLNEYPEWCYE